MTRERLPTERAGVTRRFCIRYKDEADKAQELKFYVTASTYVDGRLAEVFVRGDKMGGLLGGVLDGLAIMFSIALQYGAPMTLLTGKLRHSRFPPAGFTGDKDFPSCTSMFDLVAQWLDKEFPDGRRQAGHGPDQ